MESLPSISQFILAIVALLGLGTSFWLSRRGQNKDTVNQSAANELARRAQMHDELNSIIERLREEVKDLREEVDRVEAQGDRRLKEHKERCQATIAQMTATIAALQGVVISEVAKTAAEAEIARAEEHVRHDHQ